MKTFKWNLKRLYKDTKTLEKDFSKLTRSVKSFSVEKNKKMTIGQISKVLRLEKQIDVTYSNIFLYLTLKQDVVKEIEILKAREVEANNIYNQYLLDLIDFEHSLLKMSKLMQSRVQNSKKLIHFKPRLDKIYGARKNSKIEEKILRKVDLITDLIPESYTLMLRNSVSFKNIQINNTIKKLNSANLSKLESSPDRNVRKKVYVSKIEGIKKTGYQFCNSLNSHIYYNQIKSKSEKYTSPIEYALKDDELKETSIKSIFNVVLENKQIASHFIDIKKKILNIRTFESFDEKADLYDMSMSIKTVWKNILDSYNLLKGDSKSVVNRLKQNKHINVVSSNDKMDRTLGYCFSLGLTDPYVYAIFQNTLSSGMNIAHELGHAVHMTKLNKHNDFWNRGTSSIIMEVAAFTYELLFLFNLLKNEKNKQKKLKIYTVIAQYYYGFLYNSAMWSKFEYSLYKMALNNKPFRMENLSDKFEEIVKEFKGSYLKTNDLTKYEWIGNEFLFSSFYDLKYNMAFVIASKIAHEIINENEFYIKTFNKMLTMGDSVKTKDVLDLFSIKYNKLDTIYQEAFNTFEYYNNKIDQLI